MIHWFPGHMAKALKQIKDKSSLIDLFIVVLDARAPLSSYNMEFDAIAPNKPRLFVLTKIDLADMSKIDALKARFDHQSDAVIVVNLKQVATKKKILKIAEKLLKNKREKDLRKGLLKPRLRAIVIGVPNSGKSTLINLVAGGASAKVGNSPGVTRGQQWVNTGEIQLLDTPGILWPKIDDELIGIKLAIIGSIKLEILNQDEIFNEGYKLLTTYYPEKIKYLGLKPTKNEIDIYEQKIFLAKLKNFKLKNNVLDINKTNHFFINYLKNLSGVTYD